MAIMKTDLEALMQEVTVAGSQLRGPDAETWAARLDQDHDRIEQGLAWLLENDATAGLELALALPDYWHLRGQWAEGRAGSNGCWLRSGIRHRRCGAGP